MGFRNRTFDHHKPQIRSAHWKQASHRPSGNGKPAKRDNGPTSYGNGSGAWYVIFLALAALSAFAAFAH